MSEAMKNMETLFIYSDKAVKLLEIFSDKGKAASYSSCRGDTIGSNQTTVPFRFVANDEARGIRGRTILSSESENDSSSSSDDDNSMSHGPSQVQATQAMDTANVAISSNLKSKPSASNNKKSKSKKKSKDEWIKQMGAPPRVSITVDVQRAMKRATALQIPSALLPRPDPEEEHRNFHSDENPSIPFHKLYQLSKNLNAPISNSKDCNLILILMLQSGRFAAGIFHKGQCIRHTTSSRYTTRKGQGGAQSSNDNSKGKAKSVGSQLRRAGEVQLRQDVASTLREWKDLIGKCALFFMSLSKTLQKGFWEDVHEILRGDGCNLYKKSPCVLGIPLDVGRPSYEGCCAVYDLMTMCTLQQVDLVQEEPDTLLAKKSDENNKAEVEAVTVEKHVPPIPEIPRKIRATKPLTALHEAAKNGDVKEIYNLLSNDSHVENIDERAGEEEMTPLHYAAAFTNDTAAASECVYALLVQGHANPCILDGRNRVPYFLASVETIRNSFRKARAELGEALWKWTEGAKVGPPLSDEDVQRKKEKAAEKKRRQRQRQKDRKATELAEQEAECKAKIEQEEKARQEADARRVRAGLKPKQSAKPGEYACDFCQQICKRKSQMFERLNFHYCSTDCVKRHQRELTAAAASARLNNQN